MKIDWKYVLYGVLAVLAVWALVVFFTPKAEAIYIPKYDVCHCETPDGDNPFQCQTLNLPWVSVLAHLFQHDNDYQGACVPPPVFHSVCQQNACVQVEGEGENLCRVDADCEEPPPPTCEELQNCPTPPPVVCTENCGTPPTFAGSSTEAPRCPNGDTTQVPANVHVVRAGEMATVNGFVTEGDSVNVYWSVVGQPHWQYSSAAEFPEGVKPNGDKFVSYVVHGLNPALGYDFGVQQKNGCGGGLITAVVVDGPQPRLFMVSYYE